MPKEVSNNVLIILVVIAIFVSLTSTFLVASYVNNINPGNILQFQERNIQKNIIQSPPSTGYVGILVVPEKEAINNETG